jgi:hypothetical protein
MASLAKGALVLFCVMALIGVCFGAVYTVGDSQGWTNTAHVDYKAWADNKTFYVGDQISKLFFLMSLFLFLVLLICTII